MAKKQATPTQTTNEATTAETTERPAFLAENSKTTITIPWSEVKPAYDKAAAKLAKQMNLPGFRKGKVPAKIAQEKLKPEQLIEHTLEIVLPEQYTEQIKTEQKRPISYPEFNPLQADEGKEWVVEAFFAERPSIEIKNYQKTVKAAKKEAEKSAQEQDEKNKKAESAKEAPKADELKNQAEQAKLEHIYRNLISTFKPAVPEILLKQEVRQEMRQMAQQLEGMKLTVEDYLKQRNMEFEQLSQEVTINVLGRLQLGFILEAIVDDQKLTVTDEEVDKHIETAVAPAMRDQYKTNPQYKSSAYQTLLRKKIADYLLAI
ncbi:MAG: trigger factor [Patescibacteria group bacterium]